MQGLFNPFEHIMQKKKNPIKIDKAYINALKSMECEKSKDRTCGNTECPHNLINYDYFE